MGLDMYLNAKKYMSKYFDPTDSDKIKSINELFGIEGEEDSDFGAQEVTFRVAYWRKANAIHKWFVDNCQDGIDECQEVCVPKEKLQELLELCKEIIAEPKTASDKLPTESGFFFGGTDYDNWYMDDLEYTVKRLEKILNDPVLSNMGFYYQASW
jgi:hypothetical protein